MNPLYRTEAEIEGFQTKLVRLQVLFPPQGRSSVFDIPSIPIERPVVPPAPVVLEGMGGRSQAQVGCVVPVFAVVPRKEGAMQGKVGHLVMGVTPPLEKIRCHGEKAVSLVFTREPCFTAFHPVVQRGTLLEGQLVAGEVFGLETECGFHGFLPQLERLARHPVDEIDPEVYETGFSRRLDR
jgi:hypothetical protein